MSVQRNARRFAAKRAGVPYSQIKDGLQTNGGYRMKPFGDRLSDEEISALVSYVRSLVK